MAELLGFKITVSTEEVLKQLRDEKPDERTKKLVASWINKSKNLINPKAIVKEFKITQKGKDFVEIDNKLKIRSRNVAFLLKDCEKATFFACTLSSDFQEKSENLLVSVIVDAIGSVAVEKLAEKVSAVVCEKAKWKGFKITQRYGCGFADWSLGDQPKILKILNASKIGLKANKANILIPRKSITAIIGCYA
ncbi:MAG: hypothetical protein COT15_03370 [Candidatus Diapherotrites archaeon CG08_land_8_20_14_0_20_34_12]|nr:MAG: hypothetical protein COT15_03370 [Candidatus Diapherotrites archaeon CG08_land_8_20_14_0_20_34_12]